jgi:hypothetical protein
VRESAGDSVWAYIGSFFSIPHSGWKYTEHINCEGYPFRSAVDLWEMGIIPSYDGKVWRLHTGPDARILWQGTVEDAKNQIEELAGIL